MVEEARVANDFVEEFLVFEGFDDEGVEFGGGGLEFGGW